MYARMPLQAGWKLARNTVCNPEGFRQRSMTTPRIQEFVDLARQTFRDPSNTPPTRDQIQELRGLLELVPLAEVGLDTSTRAKAYTEADSSIVTYYHIYEDSTVSVGIFRLPSGVKMPLHNHPDMTVFSRVLYGQLNIESYDWVDKANGEAIMDLDSSRDAADRTAPTTTVMLAHTKANIHAFQALTDCAVLDLLAPPYDAANGRDCTYYKIKSKNVKEGSVVLKEAEAPADFVLQHRPYRGVKIVHTMESQLNTETLGQTIIPAINKLQDIFSEVSSEVSLDLPQVAVVGSQSSGKSSVLEALVGRDFLPRGTNIVTRRPLILQLVQVQTRSAVQSSEWAEFLHIPGKKFYDFDRVRSEISSETERTCGAGRGVSNAPIRLRVFSPHVLTMTLVDLPGLARVPVGDQPPDIESRIRQMILEYISAPSCIILAVTPANQDLAASDALDLARQVDPDGARTLGVLTKLDIMDRGTDAVSALQNEVVPLKMGYVAVVLRSQEDISVRVGVTECRARERAFFESRQEYSAVRGRCTVGRLARAINHILIEHIRSALPSLRSRLELAAAARQRELTALGDSPPGPTGAAQGAMLLTLLDSYATRFAALLEGRGDYLPTNELAGGARIRHIFQAVFTAGLDGMDPCAELSDEDVRTAIKNSGGIKGSLLIPEAPFELLVRKAIERLLPPALQCKDFVHAELLRIAAQCAPPEIARFPVLQTVLAEAVEEFIGAGAGPADEMIKNHVACELAYINTCHPLFIGGNKAISQVLERRGSETLQAENMASTSTVRGKSGSVAGLVAAAKLGKMRGSYEPALFQPEELLSARTIVEVEDPSEAEYGKNGWFSSLLFGSRVGDGNALKAFGESAGIDAPLQRPPATLKVPSEVTDQEGVQVEVTRVLVASYFDIVRKNLQDAVPKALMHFLVNGVAKGLQQHLIRTLYREELFCELMGEREDIAARRAACQGALMALKRGLTALEALPAELMEKDSAGMSVRTMLQASLDDKWHSILLEQREAQQSPGGSMRFSPTAGAVATTAALKSLRMGGSPWEASEGPMGGGIPALKIGEHRNNTTTSPSSGLRF